MTPAAPSTGRRRRGRELALRVLFEIEGTVKDPEVALRYQGDELRATADVCPGCGKSYKELKRHMAIAHPDSYVKSMPEHSVTVEEGGRG